MNINSHPFPHPTIGLVNDSPVPAGIGEHMLALADALRGRFDVVLGFADKGQGPEFLARARDMGLATHALDVGNPDASYRSFLSSQALSIAHIHACGAWEGHALGRIAKELGLPVIRTEHLPLSAEDMAASVDLRGALECVDRLLVVSQASADRFARADLLQDRIVRVLNGVPAPINSVPRAAMRKTLGVGDDEGVLLTVARFNLQKGHSILIDAFADTVRRMPDRKLRLLLVGDGPTEEAIRAMVNTQGLSDSVTFLGLRRDVGDLLAAADLFVLPSLFEGLPLVVLEAMAAGLPIVATRVGGTVEALGEGYGWLAEPGDAQDLADHMIYALREHEARTLAGRSSQARYRAHFRAERMAAETATIYQGLLQRIAA